MFDRPPARQRRLVSTRNLWLAAALLAQAGLAAAAGYRLVLDDQVVEANVFAPHQINNNGTVVGAARESPDGGNVVGAAWVGDGLTRSSSVGWVDTVNDSGMTVGTSFIPVAGTTRRRGVIWQQNGEPVSLGTLSSNPAHASDAHGVNSAGVVAMSSELPLDSNRKMTHAALWRDGVTAC